MRRILEEENKVLRHKLPVRIVHWAAALSIFVLIFSGFGQMPLYKRYMLTDISWLAWTGDYWITLYLHYVAAVVLMITAAWHVVYHGLRRDFGLIPRKGDLKESLVIMQAMATGKPEPPADKYLAEQRLAYAFMAVSTGLVIITGLVKVIKNFGIPLNTALVFWSTHLHNLAAVMIVGGIIAHLAALAIPANRNLIASMFNGKVDLTYVKHRHSIWYQRLSGKIAKPGDK